MSRDRNYAVDMVKGLCLLHMLLLHLAIVSGAINFKGERAGLYFHLMEFFMIPFFFFSGFFFTKKDSFSSFVLYKAKKLIIPLIFWSLISLPVFYVYQYLTIDNIQWSEPFIMFLSIGSLSSNDALWFLFSLFFVNVIFYFVKTRIGNEKFLFLFISLCFIYALIDRYYLPCYFSSSNISLGLVYFYIGHKTREINEDVLDFKYMLLALIVFVLISIFNPQWMQIVTLYQPEGLFILNLFYALAGTYILWYIFSKLSSLPILSYFGRNSMTFYVWHMIPLRLIWDPICKAYYPQIPCCQYIAVGGSVILLTGWLIDRYASRYCPFLIGK